MGSNTGDLISRSALYKAISVNEKGQRIPEYDCDNFPITLSLKEFKEIIKKQPTVEAEPVVHGEWRYRQVYRTVEIYCTNCDVPLSAPFKKSNFCPNCGAKMDGKSKV